MKFKYRLPDFWIEIVSNMEEFANGATQVSIKTKDGQNFNEILISNSTWIIAMRGCTDLPFNINDIVEIYQTEEDKQPKERGGWHFWDNWK